MTLCPANDILFPYLHVSIDQVVELKVIVILAKRVDQSFGNFEPSDVKSELKDKKDGHVQVQGL